MKMIHKVNCGEKSYCWQRSIPRSLVLFEHWSRSWSKVRDRSWSSPTALTYSRCWARDSYWSKHLTRMWRDVVYSLGRK